VAAVRILFLTGTVEHSRLTGRKDDHGLADAMHSTMR